MSTKKRSLDVSLLSLFPYRDFIAITNSEKHFSCHSLRSSVWPKVPTVFMLGCCAVVETHTERKNTCRFQTMDNITNLIREIVGSKEWRQMFISDLSSSQCFVVTVDFLTPKHLYCICPSRNILNVFCSL